MRIFRLNSWPLLLMALLTFTSGCTSFHKRWDEASKTPPPASGIEGRWEGTWQSEKNGHNGPLRCIISRQGENLFEAHYYAKYKWGFTFSFAYTAPLRTARYQQEYRFVGEADLGWYAGGLYQYTGQATPDRFFSTYTSKHDHGTFTLSRPAATNAITNTKAASSAASGK
jgi:hypothetical protein